MDYLLCMPATQTAATIAALLAIGTDAELNSAAAELETSAPRFTAAEVRSAGQARIDREATADDAKVARAAREAEFRARWHEEHGTGAKPRG